MGFGNMIDDLAKIDVACEKYKFVKEYGINKFDKLGNWLDKEANIYQKECVESKNSYPKFKRGEIIKVDFGVNVGTEFSHTHYAIVLNSDDTKSNDNITVIPISSKSGYKRIKLGKILLMAMPNTKKYNLDCFAVIPQIKTISKSRTFKDNVKYICNSEVLDVIDAGIIQYLTKLGHKN